MAEEAVFISYSRSERRFVQRLAGLLNDAGHTVFYDEKLIGGEEVPQAIREKINSCTHFIVIVSPEVLSSKWVQAEITAAYQAAKRIIPLEVKTTDRADAAYPPLLLNLHTIDGRSSSLPITEVFRAIHPEAFIYIPKPRVSRVTLVGAATSTLAVLCIIGWAVFQYSNGRPSWQLVKVDGEFREHRQAQTKLIRFWTPSIRTQSTRQWENVKQERVDEFGKTLMDVASVIGYRRSEVFGEGRSNEKYGWWWTVTVKDSYSVTELAKVYKEFWDPDRSTYFEIEQTTPGYGG